MHVAINAQLLSTAQSYRGAGVSSYSRQLLENLDALAAAGGTPHRMTAFVQEGALQLQQVGLAVTPTWLQNPLVRIAWEQSRLPLRLHELRADLVHGLVNVLPLATRVPGVVTVHDLSFLHFPEKRPAAKQFYLARLCRASVEKARRVIAVSRQTADDLLHWFEVDAARISVIPHGVASRFTPGAMEATERFRKERGLPHRFLLHLGTLEPRKNLETLLRAYARWLAQAQGEQREIKLVLAGGKGWFYDEIFHLVQTLGLEGRVCFPGFIPDEELPDWYRAAEAFVYPSLFEGFGMPVLEAMACGTPVMCSRARSLLEIVGKSALTFSAQDVDELVAALALMVSQPALRAELRQGGLERAVHFTWQRAAQATVQVYDAIDG